jgi:hypothetical protein
MTAQTTAPAVSLDAVAQITDRTAPFWSHNAFVDRLTYLLGDDPFAAVLAATATVGKAWTRFDVTGPQLVEAAAAIDRLIAAATDALASKEVDAADQTAAKADLANLAKVKRYVDDAPALLAKATTKAATVKASSADKTVAKLERELVKARKELEAAEARARKAQDAADLAAVAMNDKYAELEQARAAASTAVANDLAAEHGVTVAA